MATQLNLGQQTSGENTELLGLIQGMLADDTGGTTAGTLIGASTGDNSEMLIAAAPGST